MPLSRPPHATFSRLGEPLYGVLTTSRENDQGLGMIALEPRTLRLGGARASGAVALAVTLLLSGCSATPAEGSGVSSGAFETTEQGGVPASTDAVADATGTDLGSIDMCAWLGAELGGAPDVLVDLPLTDRSSVRPAGSIDAAGKVTKTACSIDTQPDSEVGAALDDLVATLEVSHDYVASAEPPVFETDLGSVGVLMIGTDETWIQLDSEVVLRVEAEAYAPPAGHREVAALLALSWQNGELPRFADDGVIAIDDGARTCGILPPDGALSILSDWAQTTPPTPAPGAETALTETFSRGGCDYTYSDGTESIVLRMGVFSLGESTITSCEPGQSTEGCDTWQQIRPDGGVRYISGQADAYADDGGTISAEVAESVFSSLDQSAVTAADAGLYSVLGEDATEPGPFPGAVEWQTGEPDWATCPSDAIVLWALRSASAQVVECGLADFSSWATTRIGDTTLDGIPETSGAGKLCITSDNSLMRHCWMLTQRGGDITRGQYLSQAGYSDTLREHATEVWRTAAGQ